MDNWIEDPKGLTAESMMRQLAQNCDRASSCDGMGFSKHDTNLGHSLVSRVNDGHAWSQKQAKVVLSLITKYSKQLGGPEFIRSWMQNPTFAKMPCALKPEKKARVYAEGRMAVFSFPYSQEMINKIKSRFAHPGPRAQYDPVSREWKVAMTSQTIAGIVDLARETNMEIDSALFDQLGAIQDQLAESHTMLVLNDGQHVMVDIDTITVAIDDATILAKLKQELGIA